MALYKEKTTKYGFIANYWRVDILTINKHTKEASCILSLYKDYEFSMDTDSAIDSVVVTSYANPNAQHAPEDLFDKYFGKDSEYENQYQACYEMAKELDEYFMDADDC